MRIFLRIVGFMMLGFLVMAIILYINGVTHVDFDDRYYRFLQDINVRLSDWSQFSIPNIPDLDGVPSGDWADDLYNAVISIANGFIWFFNLVISILDWVVDLIKFIAAVIIVFVQDLPMIFAPSESQSVQSSSSVPDLSGVFPIL